MDPETPKKSKLIIDEDWKTQVAREKEQFKKADEGGQSTQPSQAEPSATKADDSADDLSQLPPPPPASFALLVSTLGTQALAAMGQLSHGEGPAPPPRMDYAKHYIDMLGMLEEKTKSNLSPQESHTLAEWLHQLRMAFVTLSSRKCR